MSILIEIARLNSKYFEMIKSYKKFTSILASKNFNVNINVFQNKNQGVHGKENFKK